MQYSALEKKTLAPLKYEKSEIDPTDAVMGDVISDERRKENAEFPFEHRDLHESKFFSSDLETSQPHKVQIVQLKPNEEDDAINHSSDPNDVVIGGIVLNKRRKEAAEYPFEPRDIHEPKFFSSDLEISQPHKVQTLQPKPCKEDDAIDHLREDHSEMFATSPESKKLNVTEERDDINTVETEECLSKTNEEKTSRGIFTVKGIFQKMIIWTLDEKLYTGVIHHGSYINRLSKVLTG